MNKIITFPHRNNCIGFKYKHLIKMCKEIGYEKTTENTLGFITHHFLASKYNVKLELDDFYGTLFIYKNNELLYTPFNPEYNKTINFIQRIIIRFYLSRILKKETRKNTLDLFNTN